MIMAGGVGSRFWPLTTPEYPKQFIDVLGCGRTLKMYKCNNCIVHVEDAKKVVLQGLDGYIMSEKNGLILVCRHSEEQRIRAFSIE